MLENIQKNFEGVEIFIELMRDGIAYKRKCIKQKLGKHHQV
ncbi:hypothetical protein [Paraclostridium bifermentans]